MPWTRLDDGFTTHPKIFGLSDVAFRLFVGSLNLAVAHSTDGHIRGNMLTLVLAHHRDRTRTAAAAELVEVGLWDLVPGGWLIHDFAEYQDTKEQVRARREKWARQKRGQRTGVHVGQDEESTGSHPNPPPTQPKVDKSTNHLDPNRGLTLAIEEAAKDPSVKNPGKVGRYRFNQDPTRYNAKVDLEHTDLSGLDVFKEMP